MKTFLYFVLYTFLAIAAIVLGVIIGDYGSWYFAWLVGTGMIVLIAAAGAALFDSQEEEETNGNGGVHRH
ncbi:hypothetical protein [Mangrovitalea sediminis]|uniref:hypothetical protein n=1 Tax=Mangrovitalea sediminis TaxID=1982043 RepID=UPI000BE4FD58|nr:hypothetical protein [Mangrovitalea sediminis]